jgi:AAA15 family ATPase/GTPase
MLVQCTIGNYKTFKEKATLSMVASNADKKTLEAESVMAAPFNMRLLKSAVVYGANASGKSKFFDGLNFMRSLVLDSSKSGQKGEAINVVPFRLSTETEAAPSHFEVVFIKDEILYRYGFEATRRRVVSEWLFYRAKTKEVALFEREGDSFTFHFKDFAKGKLIQKENLLRDNALLLSVAAQFNDALASEVFEWFLGSKVISGLDETDYKTFSMHSSDYELPRRDICNLLVVADLGIKDIKPLKFELEDLPADVPAEMKLALKKKIEEDDLIRYFDVETTHQKYDTNLNIVGEVKFSLNNDESSGTAKFFALTAPILYVLSKGQTLFIDELDAKLHSNLVIKLLSLFNSPITNPKGAQLIFNTHNTNLLSADLFRRDQIWFTEKDRFGAASLFSLADFKTDKVRKTEAFEDNYLRGKYGAVPYLGEFDEWAKSRVELEKS